ncbi:hypothetical protein C8T65DRAFT_746114 [Cerioporus squamosus]|nr:hypothetical protein C8T65DRAFT_746114 [Cerioporus squamosus]
MPPSESTPREQPANDLRNTDTEGGKASDRAEEIRIKVEPVEESVWNPGARWWYETPVPPRAPMSMAQLMMLCVPPPTTTTKAIKEPAQPTMPPKPPKPTARMSCGPSRGGLSAKDNARNSTPQKPSKLRTMTTASAAARRELAKKLGSKRPRRSEPDSPAAGPSRYTESEEEDGEAEEPIAGPSRECTGRGNGSKQTSEKQYMLIGQDKQR